MECHKAESLFLSFSKDLREATEERLAAARQFRIWSSSREIPPAIVCAEQVDAEQWISDERGEAAAGAESLLRQRRAKYLAAEYDNGFCRHTVRRQRAVALLGLVLSGLAERRRWQAGLLRE
jgi:hypothetical protein